MNFRRVSINFLAEPLGINNLTEQYIKTRNLSAGICAPLEIEDYGVQSMPDVSPPKWHLAHTTWFFENFILVKFDSAYRVFNSNFQYLFNSYYKTVGTHWERQSRGVLSRPTVKQVLEYRSYVDSKMVELLEKMYTFETAEGIKKLTILGLNHEQQHQELLFTDIKHILCINPLYPIYQSKSISTTQTNFTKPLAWLDCEGGLKEIGSHRSEQFAFDNECPRHRVFLEPFQIASRLITNGEYLEFIEAGAYTNSEFWLSSGWDEIHANKISSPLYWTKQNGKWKEATLHGLQDLNLTQPVCHVSYFEADAFARWKEVRLPTEAEWEVLSENFQTAPRAQDNLLERARYHPESASEAGELQQLFGDVWEWTSSAYQPYPGFQPLEGSLGEYNGKFMCNQYVLKGGSCVTPASHIRRTYRNFFPAFARWQFTGIRLAKDKK